MADHRATKSGFAAEAHRKIHEKFEPEVAGRVLKWIAQTTGQDFDTDGSMENFCAVLKDGTVLCNFANALKPGSIKKITTTKMAFKQMENISFFTSFCEQHAQIPANEIFQTVDLFEAQDPNSVLVCLSALARKSEKMFGVAGFGPKEAEGDKREWTEEQLKAGDSVIGLQMGTNRVASQSGMTSFGQTRHM